jgi:hypothetical protein
LETGKRDTREFKTLDAAAKLLFKLGIADIGVKLRAFSLTGRTYL